MTTFLLYVHVCHVQSIGRKFGTYSTREVGLLTNKYRIKCLKSVCNYTARKLDFIDGLIVDKIQIHLYSLFKFPYLFPYLSSSLYGFQRLVIIS